ncbi:hypothetical protein [Neorhodopirellula pilleata]|uniref:Uncharacterized protein n=1 Tax=Neorhodopirellula pilleata TaxID=2714738 RepID=A0A5C5ZYZ4_9BACT|nr:hypothetical protein [Neorhodopirellula pilleata]TWT92305.1 hypothetical protein Pla100_48440 [Neorhodopirellula pilleata]
MRRTPGKVANSSIKMALFQKNRFVWNEPWFFVHRVRHWTAWCFLTFLLSCLGLGVASIVVTATPDGQPIDWINVALMSLGAVGIVWWVFDGTNSRRQAILTDKELIVGGDMGKYSVPTTYHLEKIPGAAIVLPEESGWPNPGLYFYHDGSEEVVGIGEQVELPRLARAIHQAGIPIRLDGWDPATDKTVAETFSWQRPEGRPNRTASIETLGDDQASLISPPAMIWAIVQQCLPFLIWAVSVGYMIWYLYQNWNQLVGYEWIIVVVLTIPGMMVMAQITERYATAATSRTLGKMVRKQIKQRTGYKIDVDAPGNFEIEVRETDQFDKLVFKIRETALMVSVLSPHVDRRFSVTGLFPPPGENHERVSQSRARQAVA